MYLQTSLRPRQVPRVTLHGESENLFFTLTDLTHPRELISVGAIQSYANQGLAQNVEEDHIPAGADDVQEFTVI
jgi:hypothetical protein